MVLHGGAPSPSGPVSASVSAPVSARLSSTPLPAPAMRCAHTPCPNETTWKSANSLQDLGRPPTARDRDRGTERDRERAGDGQRDSARLVGGVGKIESRYCDLHTCSHFFKPETCPYKKMEWDSVCITHTQCAITGCPQGKVQFLRAESGVDSTPSFWRLDFCADHLCAEPRCPYVRDHLPAARGGFQEFCEDHRCIIDNCKKLKLPDRIYCKDHKCHYGNCQVTVADKAFYCVGHLKCEMKHCPNPKQPYPSSKEYKRYCQQHMTCETQGCNAKREEDSSQCIRHTCLDRDCSKSSGNRHMFCDEHRCAHEDCEQPSARLDRRIRHDYCMQHMCRVDKCYSPVDDTTLYCEDHECAADECKSEAVLGEQCGEHFKLQLDKSTKAKSKTEKDELMKQLRDKDRAIMDIQDQTIRTLGTRQSMVAMPMGMGREYLSNGREYLGNGREYLSNGREYLSNGREPLSNGREHLGNGRELLSGVREIPGLGREMAGAARETTGGGREATIPLREQPSGGREPAGFPYGRTATMASESMAMNGRPGPRGGSREEADKP